MSREFWAIYTAGTGEILRYGEGQPGAAEMLPIAAGEALWTSEAESVGRATHYIDSGGVALAYSDAQRASKAARPNYRETHWDNVAMAWVDGRTLGQIKATQWEVMRNARIADEFRPFTWDGSEFDADERSQARIQGAVLLALLAAQSAAEFSTEWTLADNTVRTLSGADMIAVGQALSVHVAAAHALGRTKRAAIEAAETAAAVEAISWT